MNFLSETILRFWSGLNTIGGNIISLEHEGYRIITDFGALVGANINELLDKSNTFNLLKEAKLPAVPGLYEAKSLQEFPLESLEDTSIKTIICLSHLHLDHLGSFGQLSESTIVYALKEVVDFYQKLKKTQLLPSYTVNWRGVDSNQWVEFGPFRIQFVPVDHDTLGAASIFIEAPDTKIIYSGDWRLSGFFPEKVFEWAEKARNFQPDILLMEGTTFSHIGSEPSEVDLRLAKMMRSLDAKNELQLMTALEAELNHYQKCLIAFNGYPQNVDRLVNIATLINQYGRQLIMDKRYYELIQTYLPSQVNVRFIGEEDVSLSEICQQPEKYVLQVDIDSINLLFDVPAGVYYHSNGMPLGSYDPTYEPFVERICEAGWEFVSANVSGHASIQDLLLVNRVINSKVVVPWHTFQPEVYADALKKQGQTVFLPNYHQMYTWREIAEKLGVKNEKN